MNVLLVTHIWSGCPLLQRIEWGALVSILHPKDLSVGELFVLFCKKALIISASILFLLCSFFFFLMKKETVEQAAYYDRLSYAEYSSSVGSCNAKPNTNHSIS